MEGLRLVNKFLAETIMEVNERTDEEIEKELSQPLGEFLDELEKVIHMTREEAGEKGLKEMTFGDFMEGINFAAHETEDPAE